MDTTTAILGRTGLKAGRLGVAASYGAPAGAFEKAFERGCNYFYLGSGRHRSGMKQAIRHIVRQGNRDRLIISIQSYARFGLMTEFWFKRTLKSLGIDHADILILGWHNRAPAGMLMEKAVEFKQKGMVRFLGMSGHNRSLFPRLAKTDIFDLFHIRYNAAHRGAETDCFPLMPAENRPGIITYTATRWGHLLKAKHMPDNEPPLTAPDCYRFALSNPDVNLCLCGPRDEHQMDTALSVLDMPPLEPREMERIRKIGDHVRQTAKGFF